jgi:hypothetical protein
MEKNNLAYPFSYCLNQSCSWLECGEPTLPHPDIKSDDFNVDIKQQPWMVSLGKYVSGQRWEHQV